MHLKPLAAATWLIGLIECDKKVHRITVQVFSLFRKCFQWALYQMNAWDKSFLGGLLSQKTKIKGVKGYIILTKITPPNKNKKQLHQVVKSMAETETKCSCDGWLPSITICLQAVRFILDSFATGRQKGGEKGQNILMGMEHVTLWWREKALRLPCCHVSLKYCYRFATWRSEQPRVTNVLWCFQWCPFFIYRSGWFYNFSPPPLSFSPLLQASINPSNKTN